MIDGEAPLGPGISKIPSLSHYATTKRHAKMQCFYFVHPLIVETTPLLVLSRFFFPIFHFLVHLFSPPLFQPVIV
jgi:hypothetical protein